MKNFKIISLNHYRTSKAFTIFEMAIVISIIGILASISLPSYRKTLARFEANEGKQVLIAMLSSQKRYHLEFGDYAASIDDLDLEVPNNLKYFAPIDPPPSGGGCGGSGHNSNCMDQQITKVIDEPSASIGHLNRKVNNTSDPDYTLWMQDDGKLYCTNNVVGVDDCAMAGFYD